MKPPQGQLFSEGSTDFTLSDQKQTREVCPQQIPYTVPKLSEQPSCVKWPANIKLATDPTVQQVLAGVHEQHQRISQAP